MALAYAVARGANTQDLVDQVNRLIAEGWVPLGGLAIRPTTEYSDALFTQAMTKE